LFSSQIFERILAGDGPFEAHEIMVVAVIGVAVEDFLCATVRLLGLWALV